MSHPAIPAAVVRERIDDLKIGKVSDLSSLASMAGDGPEIDLTNLEGVVEVIRQALNERMTNGDGGMDDDQFEGAMSEHLHKALREHPPEVLDDPGFWAHL